MPKRLIITVCLFLIIGFVFAQNPLEVRVTITFDQVDVKEFLNQLATNGDCQFSYNPDLLPQKKVSGEYSSVKMKSVLENTLGQDFQFKVRGSYVIVQAVESKNTEQSEIQFNGEIVDASTGKQIPNTSIYEINKLTATLSDKNGFYDLRTIGDPKTMTFAISKKNYQDTVIQIDNNKKEPFKIFLKPLDILSKEKKPKRSPADSVKLVKFLVNAIKLEHMENISLTEYKPFQISFLPALGTNGMLAGEITNELSFNVIAGYNGGVNGLELGGMVNIDRLDANGVQIGGFANIVGGETNGLQLSGFTNVNLKKVNGLQFAGFVNVAQECDIQLAGFINTSRDHLLQASGFGNIAAGETKGAQLAGMFNINSKTVHGLQMAGFFNTAKDSDVQMAGFVNQTRDNTLQMSGFSNFARNSKGGQISGFTNFAWEEVTGVQISGFFNYAKSVNGVQIGLINVANKIENGFALGLLNFIKEGKHRIEIDHNDLTDINISYKSGIHHFYSIASAGISTDQNLWSYGLGLGSEIPIKESLYTDLEFSFHNIQSTDHFIEGQTNDYRFNWSIGYKISDLFSVNAGPVFHYYFFNPAQAEDIAFADQFGKKAIYQNEKNGAIHKMWIGYRIAFTIL